MVGMFRPGRSARTGRFDIAPAGLGLVFLPDLVRHVRKRNEIGVLDQLVEFLVADGVDLIGEVFEIVLQQLFQFLCPDEVDGKRGDAVVADASPVAVDAAVSDTSSKSSNLQTLLRLVATAKPERPEPSPNT